MNRSGNNYAFTLIELLIAVAILGVITSLGISGFQRMWERERVLAVSNELLGWLESARRSAIGGTSCTVDITQGMLSDGQTIVKMATGSTGLCTSSRPLILIGLTRGYRIAIDSTPTSITFTSRGTVSTESGSGNKSITITLDPGGYSRCIAINNLLGSMAIGRTADTSCDTSEGA